MQTSVFLLWDAFKFNLDFITSSFFFFSDHWLVCVKHQWAMGVKTDQQIVLMSIKEERRCQTVINIWKNRRMHGGSDEVICVEQRWKVVFIQLGHAGPLSTGPIYKEFSSRQTGALSCGFMESYTDSAGLGSPCKHLCPACWRKKRREKPSSLSRQCGAVAKHVAQMTKHSNVLLHE